MYKKTIIITGASDGIGKAAAKRLSADGHKVVIVGRSKNKTVEVAKEIGADFFLADFSKLSEVNVLADKLLEKYSHIDVLINNAGGMFSGQRQVTQDGHEYTFQVNHLAGFLLTMRMMDRLLESRATVIMTSSHGNILLGNIDINDLENKKNYGYTKAYGNAKLENIMFARELHKRYEKKGLTAVTFAPGIVRSSFAADSPAAIFFQSPIRYLHTITPEKGADTLVWLAESQPRKDFLPGEHYYKRKVANKSFKFSYAGLNKQAKDTTLIRELWERSEEMVKEFIK